MRLFSVQARRAGEVAIIWLVFCASHARAGAPAPKHARGHAMVAAASSMAVDAGMEMLRRGGSAVDAAVAIQAMLGLVEPQSSGLGGGAFLLYYDARTGALSAIDGREAAPAGAKPDMFLDEQGKPLPFLDAVRSGRSTGVPGALAMLSAAHARLGTLAWPELFRPAIRAAKLGFKAPKRLAAFLAEDSPFPASPEVRAFFSRPDGSTVRAGDVFRNPAYAATLERIAREGPAALYEGSLAAALVRRTQEPPRPGAMTLKDLAAYRPHWVEPICRPYRAHRVCVPPPPSSGLSLLQMLAILERTDIAERGPSDPQAWFLFAQASRLMYADRDRYVADPRFVPVPVDRLLDADYVGARARLIGDQAGSAPSPGRLTTVAPGTDATHEAGGTSHFVVVDAQGNVVSSTTTVESPFGSNRLVGGFVLNNQLTDFSLVPADDTGPAANAVGGGKRPRSSMSPVIILDAEGRFVAALGSPGGSAILDYNAKVVVGLLAWKLDVKAAVELPNLIARGDDLAGEIDKMSPEILSGLRKRGITLRPGHAEHSGLHAVVRKPDGTLEGAADSRREGSVQILPAGGAARR